MNNSDKDKLIELLEIVNMAGNGVYYDGNSVFSFCSYNNTVCVSAGMRDLGYDDCYNYGMDILVGAIQELLIILSNVEIEEAFKEFEKMSC